MREMLDFILFVDCGANDFIYLFDLPKKPAIKSPLPTNKPYFRTQSKHSFNIPHHMRFFLLLLIFLSSFSCKNESSYSTSSYIKVSGKTMGTTYSVVYKSDKNLNLKAEMDTLLGAINDDVSTYIPTSIISQWNQNTTNDTIFGQPHEHFDSNVSLALDIADKTNGSFEPTITPLVNYWGFGYAGKNPVTEIDSVKIDSLMEFVGFELLEWSATTTGDSKGKTLMKLDDRVQLNLGGSAKGYALDQIAALLETNGIVDYMVEIGLEVKCKGKNPKGRIWTIGINTPKVEAKMTDVEAIVQLDNLSVATSGNYRQSYEIDGQKIAHIISPKTGFPTVSNLLSVSVFHPECGRADAYATAFMVMGLEDAMSLANDDPDLEALFITSKPDGSFKVNTTNGMDQILVE